MRNIGPIVRYSNERVFSASRAHNGPYPRPAGAIVLGCRRGVFVPVVSRERGIVWVGGGAN